MAKPSFKQQQINRVAQNNAQSFIQKEIDNIACGFFREYSIIEYDIKHNDKYKVEKRELVNTDDFLLVKISNNQVYYIFHYAGDTEHGSKYQGFRVQGVSGFAYAFQELEKEIDRKNKEYVYVNLLKKALKAAKF